jgi:ABC-type transport system involved in multi-copper enzyme maturation permease subunit
MTIPAPAEETGSDIEHVGPFTGFGNFMRKEIRDWWNSWRLIIDFAIPTLIMALAVFFAYNEMWQRLGPISGHLPNLREIIGNLVLLWLFQDVHPGFFIIIIIFSTMGLLTTEKSTGTLAWNLTKPLGRTGLFVAKWLVATVTLCIVMCVLPVVIAAVCMRFYHGISPDVAKLAPVVGCAILWIGFWVLLVLTISLGFQSAPAVGGIAIACWIVPFLFGTLMGAVFGHETRDWILDRFAPRSPFWAFPLVGDKDLVGLTQMLRGSVTKWKTVWIYAFGFWSVVLAVFSLRIFNRQEIGA